MYRIYRENKTKQTKQKTKLKKEINGSKIANTKLKNRIGKFTLLDFNTHYKAIESR